MTHSFQRTRRMNLIRNYSKNVPYTSVVGSRSVFSGNPLKSELGSEEYGNSKISGKSSIRLTNSSEEADALEMIVLEFGVFAGDTRKYWAHSIPAELQFREVLQVL